VPGGEQVAAGLREADGVLVDAFGTEPPDVPGQKIEDARARRATRVAGHGEAASVGVPPGDGVLRAGADAEHAALAGAVGVDDVAVQVLRGRRLFARVECDPRPVLAE